MGERDRLIQIEIYDKNKNCSPASARESSVSSVFPREEVGEVVGADVFAMAKGVEEAVASDHHTQRGYGGFDQGVATFIASGRPGTKTLPVARALHVG